MYLLPSLLTYFIILKFRGLVIPSKDERWPKAKLSNIALKAR